MNKEKTTVQQDNDQKYIYLLAKDCLIRNDESFKFTTIGHQT